MTDPGIVFFPPATHPLSLMVKSDRGRLQMENKELPGEEKAIMVWPDVQPNAKNSISRLKHKKNQTKGLPSPFHL